MDEPLWISTHLIICQYLLLIMSIKQAQRITSLTLNAIDEGIWREVAIKAITKMPRIQLTNQSNKLFQDFALMNGHDPKSFLRNLSQQNEQKETFIDNLLVGNIRAKPANRKFSEGDLISSQNAKKKPENLNIRITNRSKTQVNAFLDKSQVPKICTRLFVSQLPYEEYQNVEGQLRKTKAENIRYNTRLQQMNRERLAKSQQHSQNETKKFKEIKTFTYDYEGKLLGMKAKQNGNIKFVHIKAKFHQSAGKEHRSFIQKLQKSKYSQVTQKKVINGDDNYFTEPIRDEKYGKNIPPNLNNSLYDLFKDDRSIQMGVSIIDKANYSKLVNRENPLGKSIKLSDFKKSFKSSSIVNRKKYEKLATLESNSPKLSDKDFLRVKTVSDAQSKILSSAFSRYSKQLGKININNSKAFMDSFYNDN